jgi:hypothetical protein
VGNTLQNIGIGQIGIVKAGCINEDDMATATVRVGATDGADLLSARFQIMANNSMGLLRHHVNKLATASGNWYNEHYSPYRAFACACGAHDTVAV